MDRHVDAAYDECCVILLRATSPRDVLAAVDAEEHQGVPVYPRPGTLRWGKRVCRSSDCFEQFSPAWAHSGQLFCCSDCQHRDSYRRREATFFRWRRDQIRAVVAQRVVA